MAERLPPELSPSARELLRTFRADESPAVEQRRAGWAALSARLHDEGGAVQAAGRGAYYAKVVGVTVALAAGLLLAVKLVGLGVTTLAHDDARPGMEAPYQGGAESEGGQAVARDDATEAAAKKRTRAAKPSTPAVEAEPEIEAAPEPAAETSAELAPTVRPRPKPTKTSSSTASDLKAELAIMNRAHQAKKDRRFEAALTALREHERRFPSGTLVDVRLVLRAEVLCAAGRRDEARSEVRRFLSRRGSSDLAGRMRAVCKS